MNYISTRGDAAPKSFTDVLMAGLAPDGGLYVPEAWPHFDAAFFRGLRGKSYADIAFAILRAFTGGDPADAELQSILRDTYNHPAFDHDAVAPLVQLGPDLWLLELFHGPTLSFKDYALQLIGRLFDRVLKARGQTITIVGATSGDTGSAAIAGCLACENIRLVMLHPKGRISDVQRLQMTTVDSPRIQNIAIDGTFDDCQALVKQLFADEALRSELKLSAVNSINWARILAQTVYYVAASLALGAPDRPVAFVVPTGNFGNIYAGHVARMIGLPIQSLTIATNRNDILTRFFETGAMEKHGAAESLSPAMDIQVSSNFERYLFELTGRDAAATAAYMADFAQTGRFAVPPALLAAAQKDFSAIRCSDEDTLAVMRRAYNGTGLVIDPHTAVALHAAWQRDAAAPTVIISTAHPAKFPSAVKRATGLIPVAPASLQALGGKPEKLMALPNDLRALKTFLRTPIS